MSVYFRAVTSSLPTHVVKKTLVSVIGFLLNPLITDTFEQLSLTVKAEKFVQTSDTLQVGLMCIVHHPHERTRVCVCVCGCKA